MKKLSVLVVALFLMTSSIYAKGKYSGDVQVHAGASLDYQGGMGYVDSLSLIGNMDIQNWNLFELNDDVSVGFFLSLDGGAGKYLMRKNTSVSIYTGVVEQSFTDSEKLKAGFSFSMMFGPAISFKVGNTAKINIGAGLVVNFIEILSMVEDTGYYGGGVKDYFENYASLGFGFDVNAKFCPDSKVSPVVGYRFSLCGDSTLYYDYSSVHHWMQSAGKITVIKNTVYVGVAFNL